jgi:hypothetical protein
MPHETPALDALINDLGSVRAASFAAHASGAVKDAIDQAISEATQTLVDVLNTPFDGPGLTRARAAIEVAEDVIGALCEEMLRSERVRLRGAALQGRAQELVERARLARSGRGPLDARP